MHKYARRLIATPGKGSLVSPPKGIVAVFFDFSGTLVRGALDIPRCRESVVALLRSKGYPVSLNRYNSLMASVLEARRASRVSRMELSSEEMEGKLLRMLGINPTPDLISQVEDIEFGHYRWRLQPGVRDALNLLAGRYRLGVISNSASNSVVRVLRSENLLHFFDSIILSKDVGFRKPDRRIFAFALNRLGVRADEALFVGDNFVQDVQGAREMGMMTIWLTDSGGSGGLDFDATAKGVNEVPRIIEELLPAHQKQPGLRSAPRLL